MELGKTQRGYENRVYKRGPLYLWQLTTSNANPPKAKSSALGALMVTVLAKIVVRSIVSEDGPINIILGACVVASPCVLSHDLGAMIGDHSKQTMSYLQYIVI